MSNSYNCKNSSDKSINNNNNDNNITSLILVFILLCESLIKDLFHVIRACIIDKFKNCDISVFLYPLFCMQPINCLEIFFRGMFFVKFQIETNAFTLYAFFKAPVLKNDFSGKKLQFSTYFIYNLKAIGSPDIHSFIHNTT